MVHAQPKGRLLQNCAESVAHFSPDAVHGNPSKSDIEGSEMVGAGSDEPVHDRVFRTALLQAAGRDLVPDLLVSGIVWNIAAGAVRGVTMMVRVDGDSFLSRSPMLTSTSPETPRSRRRSTSAAIAGYSRDPHRQTRNSPAARPRRNSPAGAGHDALCRSEPCAGREVRYETRFF